MRKIFTLFAIVTLSFYGSSCSEIGGGSSSAAEVDSLIEEIWLDVNEGTEVPLDQWMAKSPKNEIDFINRKDALAMAANAKGKFSVSLSVIVDSEDPTWTQFVIARVDKVSDKEGLKALLIEASSENHLEAELGNKWLYLGGKYKGDDSGEYLKK